MSGENKVYREIQALLKEHGKFIRDLGTGKGEMWLVHGQQIMVPKGGKAADDADPARLMNARSHIRRAIKASAPTDKQQVIASTEMTLADKLLEVADQVNGIEERCSEKVRAFESALELSARREKDQLRDFEELHKDHEKFKADHEKLVAENVRLTKVNTEVQDTVYKHDQLVKERDKVIQDQRAHIDKLEARIKHLQDAVRSLTLAEGKQ